MLDASIPLRVLNPGDLQRQTDQHNAANLQQSLGSLQQMKAKNDIAAQILAGVKDQASYDMGKQKARELLGNDVLAGIPDQYDPQVIDQLNMSTLSAGQRIQMQLQQAQFGAQAEQRQYDRGMKERDFGLRIRAADTQDRKVNSQLGGGVTFEDGTPLGTAGPAGVAVPSLPTDLNAMNGSFNAPGAMGSAPPPPSTGSPAAMPPQISTQSLPPITNENTGAQMTGEGGQMLPAGEIKPLLVDGKPLTDGLEKGQQWGLDTATNRRVPVDIPGYRSADERKFEAKKKAAEPKARTSFMDAMASIDGTSKKLQDAKGKVSWNTAGLIGYMLEDVGGSEAANLRANLDTIKARLGFAELAKMRANSPTGGALGGIAQQELAFLQSVEANLSQSQSVDQLKENIAIANQSIKESKERIKQGYIADFGSLPPGYEDSSTPASNPSANIPTFSSPSDEAFGRLPKGSQFMTKDGQIRTKQ